MKEKTEAEPQDSAVDDEYSDWSDFEYYFFGPGRKFRALEPNLISLYGANFPERFPNIKDGPGNPVMFLVVSMRNLEVIEHMYADANLTHDEWRSLFRGLMVQAFSQSPKKLYDQAFELFKTGGYRGEAGYHRLCMELDEIYPHMDEEDQRTQRIRMRAGIDERLHPERRKDRPSEKKKRQSKKVASVTEKSKNLANPKARPSTVQRNTKRGEKIK